MLLDQLVDAFGLSIFTAGLTVGMTYMALRGRLDRLQDAVQYLQERIYRVEKKVETHLDKHVA